MVFNVTETMVCEVINLFWSIYNGRLCFKCLMAVYRTMEVEDGELGSNPACCKGNRQDMA